MDNSAFQAQLDFSEQQLQGRSFKDQNLRGAKFAGADLRSTDFSGANLTGADFRGAKFGLNRRWQLILMFIVGLIIGMAGAGCSVSGIIAIQLLHPVYIAKHSPIPGLTSVLIISGFMLALVRWGLQLNLVILSAIVPGVLFISQIILWSTLGSAGLEIGDATAWGLAGAWAWALVGVVFGGLGFQLGRMALQRRAYILVSVWAVGMSLALLAFWQQLQQPSPDDSDSYAHFAALGPWIGIVLWACILGGLSLYIHWSLTREQHKFSSLQKTATWLNTLGGTNFQGADLTQATFAGVDLAQTNLSSSQIARTSFHLAQNLQQAKLNHTILQHRSVRNLLTSLRGTARSYTGCNLQGAYLVGADLADADLSDANLCGADLSQASLERSNLTRAQAVGTNLQLTQMTAACIEAWNIDQTTNLDQIQCDFVYLLQHQQERSPSSGNFQAGEFTRLFQKAIDTVDLIIRDGVDWSGLNQTLQQLQVQHGEDFLEVRSIENKGDGMVVVRVAVAPESNKAELYESFQATYTETIQTLQAKHQAELAAKDAQIELYQSHQADLKQITQLLATNHPTPAVKQAAPIRHKCVTLTIGTGSLATGFAATLQISDEGQPADIAVTGELAAAPQLQQAAQAWQAAYQRSANANYRIKIADTQVTHVSYRDLWKDCETTAEIVIQQINQWLNHDRSRPLKERLLEQLTPNDVIRFLVQTDHPELQHLPLQTWDWFDRYPKAELALSNPNYQQIRQASTPQVSHRILAILGNDQGINIERDRTVLEHLSNADVVFLPQPTRQQLNEQLWEQDWDILFFAGHSQSTDNVANGHFQINEHDTLSIPQLRHGLKKAVDGGLQLAIFNSCDGLGIANRLNDLHIPQMVVMREPIPDLVAQEFLKHFLKEFTSGTTLYQSVRAAREKLQGLENQFPCASWLPVIYQNPSAAPMQWVSTSSQRAD